MKIVIADNQALTCQGMIGIAEKVCPQCEIMSIGCKKELVQALLQDQDRVVVVDMNNTDIDSAEVLKILSQRFQQTMWLLLSEDIDPEALRQLLPTNKQFGALLKSDSLEDIESALRHMAMGKRYICPTATEIMLDTQGVETERIPLSEVEKAILKAIALGKTSKEIAAERSLSFHTVSTHRKNIFRKICVNNAHDATKYALKAGLLNMADYSI